MEMEDDAASFRAQRADMTIHQFQYSTNEEVLGRLPDSINIVLAFLHDGTVAIGTCTVLAKGSDMADFTVFTMNEVDFAMNDAAESNPRR